MKQQIDRRTALPSLINSPNPRGVELGVARGSYSQALMRYPWETLYLVDRWSDHHDHREKEMVVSHFKKYRNVKIVHDTFTNARPMIDDESLDFVYIDGYAHLGQEGGKTLEEWWTALKPGGVFCGHDYHERWQPTIDAVNAFVKKHNIEHLGLTKHDQYPSWWCIR
jgi:SAM-dependent methyltransferase